MYYKLIAPICLINPAEQLGRTHQMILSLPWLKQAAHPFGFLLKFAHTRPIPFL